MPAAAHFLATCGPCQTLGSIPLNGNNRGSLSVDPGSFSAQIQLALQRLRSPSRVSGGRTAGRPGPLSGFPLLQMLVPSDGCPRRPLTAAAAAPAG